jgi:hypothetical protein
MYAGLSPVERGLIQAHEEPAMRHGKATRRPADWNMFSSSRHTVFHHTGFNEMFEVIDDFVLPGTDRDGENEVLLARSHSRPVIVEFTRQDRKYMNITNDEPKYGAGLPSGYNL